MLQVARLAPRLLSDASERVLSFFRSQMHETGGFRNRADEPDLYYTVFGLEGLAALRADLPVSSTADYLATFGNGESLDFVHLACLVRCWANLPAGVQDASRRDRLIQRLDGYRAADGGYHAEPGSALGTVYASFLAAGAYQDLGVDLPDSPGLVRSVKSLTAHDGGFSNQPDAAVGSTPATAAAVTLLRHFDAPGDSALGNWLLSRCRPEGGFFAAPGAPLPDLLSTATALHALVGVHVSIEEIKEPCLDFIDSLWTSTGGFYGHWSDDVLDCEYTYYALLALGHLSF